MSRKVDGRWQVGRVEDGIFIPDPPEVQAIYEGVYDAFMQALSPDRTFRRDIAEAVAEAVAHIIADTQ